MLRPFGPVTVAVAEPSPRVTERLPVLPRGPVAVLDAPEREYVFSRVVVPPFGPVTLASTEFFVRVACRLAVLPLGPVAVD
jgi:hypothetical protein